MCTPEGALGSSGGGGSMGTGVARSPSHESVTTDLSLFSVSSAASDAKVLRLLACKAGQGPDPSLRVASPNPDSRNLRRPMSALPLDSAVGGVTADGWRGVLAGCAALCAQLGLRRSFSAGDAMHHAEPDRPLRNATSEVGLCAALEALTLNAASRSCSTWVAVGGSQLPSPQRSNPAPPPAPARTVPGDNKKVRQNYIKRRLLTTYRALERMSQSEFNLDKLEVHGTESRKLIGAAQLTTLNNYQQDFCSGREKMRCPLHLAAAVSAVAVAVTGPGPTSLAVPTKTHTKFVHPEAAHLALTAADLERERGRPLSKYERNMMIFNWLHTLDDAAPF